MPSIPIPLTAGEAPVEVDLQICHDTVCREGQYVKDIDYSVVPPPSPLSDEDQVWMRQLQKQ